MTQEPDEICPVCGEVVDQTQDYVWVYISQQAYHIGCQPKEWLHDRKTD